MNISVFCSKGSVYTNCECVKGCAFKNAALWVKCALLPHICAIFGLLRGYCAHYCRIECLLPHMVTA
jgi:ribose/xylose/arabinose/galactoside ABC-type transport system permease subunit